MSKKHKKRKHKHQHQHQWPQAKTTNVTTNKPTTTKTVRREPIAVAETVKHSSNVKTPLTVETTFPNHHYKVLRKPDNWAGPADFAYVDQVGLCLATDRLNGARIQFLSGESIPLPFEILELVSESRPELPIVGTIEEMPVVATKVVTSENVKKGGQYKVVRKPSRWRTQCKFLGRVGVCVLIDDRGVRLRFADGDGVDVSFESECLEEVAPMDLNNNNTQINEDNVSIGEAFRIVKVPSNFGSDAERLVGKVGKAKWTSYRGVCLKLDDGGAYTIEYDCIERFTTRPETANPTKVPVKLSANNIVLGRKYKFAKIPNGWSGDKDLLGKMAEVIWASDLSGARLRFNGGKEYTIPFDCVEDLARPDEIDLIVLIRKNPERILRIIKGLNKLTRLRPVRDFIEKGKLPGDDEQTTTKPVTSIIPAYHSESLPVADSVSDEVEQMKDRVLALIGPIQPTESNNPS